MTIEISTDPERIAALRAEAEEQHPNEPLERFFRELPEMYSIREADRRLLREHRREASPRLLEIASRDLATTAEGAMAILALCALEAPAVPPIAREALRDEKATWRHVLMRDDGAFLGTDTEIRRMLLAALDSPDPRTANNAVQDCGVLKIPGAVERFVEFLRRPDAPDRPRLAYWIGALDPTPASVAVIEAAWLDEPTTEDEDYWFLTALASVASAGAPEARRAAVNVLLRWFAEINGGARRYRGMSNAGALHSALDALRRAAPENPGCAAVAADLLRDPNSPFEYFEQSALEVIAAGNRPQHREMALRTLQSANLFSARAAAKSMGTAYVNSGDSEIVAAILEASGRHGPNEAFTDALAKIGGAEAEAAAEAGVGDHPSLNRMRVLWRTRKLDPQAALDRLAALGALRKADGLAKTAQETFREAWPDREAEPAEVFLDALRAAGLLVGFDTEASEIPPRHDKLILSLSEATRGAFVVEAARQTWHLPPGVSIEDNIDDVTTDNSHYSVEFLHEGRIVTFRAAYHGDWYDTSALITALNEALRDSGRAERFHRLIEEDQYASFVLITPAIAKIARRDWFVPLDKPLQAGRKAKRGK